MNSPKKIHLSVTILSLTSTSPLKILIFQQFYLSEKTHIFFTTQRYLGVTFAIEPIANLTQRI